VDRWATEIFGPPPSVPRIVGRANEEMAELVREATCDGDLEKVAEEAADVLILLYRLASKIGVDLHEEVDRKMRKNKGRTWAADVGGGTGRHVRKGKGK
jgi:NTP pyrophosphatase (non-canonical NTP hydrolase)